MIFIALLLILGALGIFMPKTYKVIEVLVLAPIVGCAFGGFSWAIMAMLFGYLINWTAFGSFLFGGTVITWLAFARAS